MTYRIRDWDKHFENASSRKLKRLDWVALPNKTDGEGYTALVDHPNGAAHFGAWVAIVEIASKQNPRGNLPVGGICQDVGRICQALGRISRLPAKLYEEVLPRLVEIGWIEQLQSNQQPNLTLGESANALGESANTSADCGSTLQGIELQGTTRNRTTANEQATVVRSHAEFPETAKAIRESYPATDDIFVMKLCAAVQTKVLSTSAPLRGYATDAMIADAVRDCRRNSPKQNSPGLFSSTVPQCVLTWLTQGKTSATVVPIGNTPYDRALQRARDMDKNGTH